MKGTDQVAPMSTTTLATNGTIATPWDYRGLPQQPGFAQPIAALQHHAALHAPNAPPPAFAAAPLMAAPPPVAGPTSPLALWWLAQNATNLRERAIAANRHNGRFYGDILSMDTICRLKARIASVELSIHAPEAAPNQWLFNVRVGENVVQFDHDVVLRFLGLDRNFSPRRNTHNKYLTCWAHLKSLIERNVDLTEQQVQVYNWLFLTHSSLLSEDSHYPADWSTSASREYTASEHHILTTRRADMIREMDRAMRNG